MKHISVITFVCSAVIGAAFITFIRAESPISKHLSKIQFTGERVSEILWPSWFEEVCRQENCTTLRINELNSDEDLRLKEGYIGNNYMHSKDSHVRILEYALLSNSCDDGKLVGLVHFTKNAESHKGLCHGGLFLRINMLRIELNFKLNNF